MLAVRGLRLFALCVRSNIADGRAEPAAILWRSYAQRSTGIGAVFDAGSGDEYALREKVCYIRAKARCRRRTRKRNFRFLRKLRLSKIGSGGRI
jgi:hypothetical protein